MLVISTREFRDKQKSYLDKAELDSVIEQGLLDIKEGRTKRYPMEELREKTGI